MKIVKLIFLLTFVYNCSSGEVTLVKPVFGENIKSLGQVSGSSCGTLFGGPTAYNFIPLGLNGRVESAHEEALKQIPGAKGLINVSISESWFWVLSIYRCTTIKGEAIQWD